MQAAARQNLNSPFKNTIAVFRMDNTYTIQDSRIIGLPMAGSEDKFDPNVDFDIHCIVESANPTGYYIICGSIRRGDGTGTTGIVVVLDAGLNTVPSAMGLREYPDVSHFYSVYAQDNYYYVCGRKHDGRGIVLRDNVTNYVPMAMAYITLQQWDYQKIRIRDIPGSGEIRVSGTGYSDDGVATEMGYTAFDIRAGNFSILTNTWGPASWKWVPIGHSIGSKVMISNHPGGSGGLGLIVSVSNANGIYTYLFFSHPALNSAFHIPCPRGVLEDVECAPDNGNGPRIAWVGNTMPSDDMPQQRAYFLRVNLPHPLPNPNPFPGAMATFTYFQPFPTTNNAFYSLHKVYFERTFSGNGEFHAGGYYKHSNNNKTTFAVTPELIYNNCVTRNNVHATAINIPVGFRLQSLVLLNDRVNVNELGTLSKKYHFCPVDCDNNDLHGDGDECGNHLIIIDNK